MYQDEILEKLMNCGIDTCPCEKGIPCPDFNETNEDAYCKYGNCLDAMTRLVYKTVKENLNDYY